MKEKLQMSIKEAKRLSVMQQIDKKYLTLRDASKELGLSLRQTKRVRKRYRLQGERGLISLKKNCPSNRKIDQKIKDQTLEMLKGEYAGFGPTFASEKLRERDGIHVSSETIRKWQIEAGLWEAKKTKERRVFQRRARRSCFGELVQGDGSPHDWFEGRAEKCSLLQFVDDATSRTTAAKFVVSETTEGYQEILKEHLEKYGKPEALYVDKHGIFRVNREEIQKGKGITHFGRVLKELGIELICANSPQAKGRVERKNGVFQDRLIKEMRLRGISSIEEGNAYLPEFLEKINQKFGKEPASKEDAHRPLRKEDDLERIFARKEPRKLSKNLTFQHRGTLYQIETKTPNRLRYATVEVIWKEGQLIIVEYRGEPLKYKKWSETVYEQPTIQDSKEIALRGRGSERRRKPGKHHPWK